MAAWTDEERSLLGTAPDTQIAGRLGRSVDSVRRERKRLGIAAYQPPVRTCRCCDRRAVSRVGLCHTHYERWRRWGQPPVAEWAAAYLAERLNTCERCGRGFNGAQGPGIRFCGANCLAAHKREQALAHWHRRTPESKRAAIRRARELRHSKRQERQVHLTCRICDRPFRGFAWRVYCSPACRQEATNRCQREFRRRVRLLELLQQHNTLIERLKHNGQDDDGTQAGGSGTRR